MTRALTLTLALLAMTSTLFASPLPVHRQNIVTGNNASCDLGTYPAATLLLPYFEVDVNAPANLAVNTVFTVINTSRMPQMVRVTIWTDLGFPASWFNMFLSGYDVHTVSLYEVLARGNFPVTSTVTQGAASADNGANPNFFTEYMCDQMGGTVPPSMVERIKRVLTTGERDEPGCLVGNKHKNAVGYITIDVINSCAADSPTSDVYWNEVLLYDNVLTGDYQRINPDPGVGNYTGGGPLVHLRAIPEGGLAGSVGDVPMPHTFYDRYTPAGFRKADRRQPLPSVFAARFIQGGPGEFQTNFTIWREGIVGSSRQECEYAKNARIPVNAKGVVRFDEHENAIALASNCTDGPCVGPLLPVVSSQSSAAAMFPPLASSGDVAGWFWMSLDHGLGVANGPYSSARASQNWVTVQMQAEGRYAVDFDATWLANGCTARPPAAP